MTSWSALFYLLRSSFWLFLLHIVEVLQQNTGERLACGCRSRTCCHPPTCLRTRSTWVWRDEAAGFKHDGDLRDNNYCIPKPRNYSEQWKPVPGLSKHLFPWGGQRKAWENRFRPRINERQDKTLENIRSILITVLSPSDSGAGVTTKLQSYLWGWSFEFLLNLFFSLLAHATRFPFSHTGYFLTDLLTIFFWGQRFSPLWLGPVVSHGSWSITEVFRCHHHLSTGHKRIM